MDRVGRPPIEVPLSERNPVWVSWFRSLHRAFLTLFPAAEGSTTVWARVEGEFINGLPTSGPDWGVFVSPTYAWAFRNGETNTLYFTIRFPVGVKAGTIAYPYFRWASGSTATATVRWNYAYAAAKDGQVFQVVANKTVDVAPSGTANESLVLDLDPIPGEYVGDATIVTGLIRRYGSADANAADAFGLAVGAYVEIETLGAPSRSAQA